MQPLRAALAAKPLLLLSVAAGIPCARLAEWSSPKQAIVRCMPNTPALVQAGASALYANAVVSAEQRDIAGAILQAVGLACWLDQEAQMDAVTALSGSGPAYVFYFIEAMMQAGAEMGLEPAQARRLAQETFAGAAALAAQSDEPPEVLRERVTSKGGTTYAALSSLEASGVKAAFVRALHAARDRAEELGR
jgi:pyrroline-5-carboxylate reductase